MLTETNAYRSTRHIETRNATFSYRSSATNHPFFEFHALCLNMPLRLLIDASVSNAADLFGRHGDVTRMPGREIRTEHLAGVDALVVRSVTPVTEALLRGTSVRFVGSATAGVDHVDLGALERLGIAFASAPGSNADSVADYVVAALLAVAADRDTTLREKTLGVVGCGEVGSRVVRRGAALGMRVVGCDPFLTEPIECPLVSLKEVLAETDILTLHVPLTDPQTSTHPTRGMIGAEAFQAMKRGCWLVNTARGGVVDEGMLIGSLRAEQVSAAVLDVWENEPSPNPELIDLADIATPHIAGYALDAKLRGALMIEAAMRGWLEGDDVPSASPVDPASILRPGPDVRVPRFAFRVPRSDVIQVRVLDVLVKQVYDVRADDARFRAASESAQNAWFSDLRKGYPARREMRSARVIGEIPEGFREAVEEGLGVGMVES